MARGARPPASTAPARRAAGAGEEHDHRLLAQYNVTTPAALPPLVQLRVRLLHEQLTLLGDQARRLAAELNPVLIPTPDVQRLLWIPGIGRVVAFTIWREVDGIGRFPSARDFVSYCRLVPGAGNSGGKTRHKRMKDGNRYLKLAFSHAAVRAIQYFPEIRVFYHRLCRRKPPVVARAVVAKELARIVYYVLTKQEAFNGTFKGKPLSRTKQPKWPRLASPPRLTGAGSPSRVSPSHLIGRQAVCRRLTSGTSACAANPQWCVAATEASGRDRHEVASGIATTTAAVLHIFATRSASRRYRKASATLLRPNSRMALGRFDRIIPERDLEHVGAWSTSADVCLGLLPASAARSDGGRVVRDLADRLLGPAWRDDQAVDAENRDALIGGSSDEVHRVGRLKQQQSARIFDSSRTKLRLKSLGFHTSRGSGLTPKFSCGANLPSSGGGGHMREGPTKRTT